jgi:membrane fusion protein, multidrug efflux system
MDAKKSQSAKAARLTDETGALIDQGDTLTQTIPTKPSSPTGHNLMQRRRLLMAALATLVLAIAIILGIPWIRETLNTVSTDDAYVNGHVTFVGSAGAWSGVKGSGG